MNQKKINPKKIIMVTQTIYDPHDLDHGQCTCCGETSDEILKGDWRCIDCIEEEKFIDMTMRGDSYRAEDLEDW